MRLGKKKIGYFTLFEIKISETFIHDLIESLQEEDKLSIINYNGGNSNNTLFNSISLGYSLPMNKWVGRFYYVIRLFTKSIADIRMKMNKGRALRILENKVSSEIEAAYVDFATTGVLLMDYFKKKQIPFIVHVHGYDITMQLSDASYHRELLNLFNLADKFITASNYMRRRLVLLGCPKQKIEVIRYGISDKGVNVLEWNERSEAPSIIFLGRLTDKKSPIALVHAFKIVLEKLPRATLSIIGDGPLRIELERLISKHQLNQSIKIYGALNREKSFKILRRHWVYAQHSVTAVSGDTEGFAISLAEAALHELPVVSTIHNGITENVIDGETGFLVPEYDYELMAEKIILLLTDRDLSMSFGKRGRQNILDKNKQNVRTEKISSLLNEI